MPTPGSIPKSPIHAGVELVPDSGDIMGLCELKTLTLAQVEKTCRRCPSPISLVWNKRYGERSDQRRWFHTRSVWLGRRRSRCRARANCVRGARQRTGYGALT